MKVEYKLEGKAQDTLRDFASITLEDGCEDQKDRALARSVREGFASIAGWIEGRDDSQKDIVTAQVLGIALVTYCLHTGTDPRVMAGLCVAQFMRLAEVSQKERRDQQ